MAEVSNCSKGHMADRAKNIVTITIYREMARPPLVISSLPTGWVKRVLLMLKVAFLEERGLQPPSLPRAQGRSVESMYLQGCMPPAGGALSKR